MFCAGDQHGERKSDSKGRKVMRATSRSIDGDADNNRGAITAMTLQTRGFNCQQDTKEYLNQRGTQIGVFRESRKGG